MAEVRGHSAVTEPASIVRRLGALAVDAFLVWGAYLMAASRFRLDAAPRLYDLPILFALYLVYKILFTGASGATPGERAWTLERLDPLRKPLGLCFSIGDWRASRVFRPQKLHRLAALRGGFLTVLAAALFAGAGYLAWSSNPVLAQATEWKLEPYLPSTPEARESWDVTPFFYAIGAWPKSFKGQPVLYSLPYAKGPPTQFVGRIIARWEAPMTELVIEGPKTPIEIQKAGTIDADRIRECLTAPAITELAGPCREIREQALGRHVREMGAVHPSHWTLKWFEVQNTALPSELRPRGFYLRADGPTRSEERYVLVTGRGSHQAFILDRPSDRSGELARMTLEQAIRSQRISPALGEGRAWVDRQLASTKLGELSKDRQDEEQFVSRLSEIQLLLLSKISVDPKTFDSYFHLGGTALMLARYAASHGNPDWSAVARPLAQSAYLYARDIAPGDPRTSTLQGIWLDAKKY
jgi:hypothetical protein